MECQHTKKQIQQSLRAWRSHSFSQLCLVTSCTEVSFWPLHCTQSILASQVVQTLQVLSILLETSYCWWEYSRLFVVFATTITLPFLCIYSDQVVTPTMPMIQQLNWLQIAFILLEWIQPGSWRSKSWPSWTASRWRWPSFLESPKCLSVSFLRVLMRFKTGT